MDGALKFNRRHIHGNAGNQQTRAPLREGLALGVEEDGLLAELDSQLTKQLFQIIRTGWAQLSKPHAIAGMFADWPEARQNRFAGLEEGFDGSHLFLVELV